MLKSDSMCADFAACVSSSLTVTLPVFLWLVAFLVQNLIYLFFLIETQIGLGWRRP